MIFKYCSGTIGTRLRFGLASVIALVVAFGVNVVAESPAQADTQYPYSDGCYSFAGDFGYYCLQWTGGYPNGYVRALIPMVPTLASVGIEECTSGPCQPGVNYGISNWHLVAASYNYPSMPAVSPAVRVSKFGAYRACSQSVPGGVWTCMWWSTYLGD